MIAKKEVITVQNYILDATRRFFRERDFLEIQSPIISSVTDPGLRGAEIASIDYYGERMKVTSSMIFHKQLAASVYGKVFSISPNVRLESKERRETKEHLSEFRQIEVEVAFSSYRDVMKIAEDLFREIIKDVGKKIKLREFNMDFKEYSYKEIVSKYGIEYGEEIPSYMEKEVSEDCFVWITEYP